MEERGKEPSKTTDGGEKRKNGALHRGGSPTGGVGAKEKTRKLAPSEQFSCADLEKSSKLDILT